MQRRSWTACGKTSCWWYPHPGIDRISCDLIEDLNTFLPDSYRLRPLCRSYFRIGHWECCPEMYQLRYDTKYGECTSLSESISAKYNFCWVIDSARRIGSIRMDACLSVTSPAFPGLYVLLPDAHESFTSSAIWSYRLNGLVRKSFDLGWLCNCVASRSLQIKGCLPTLR